MKKRKSRISDSSQFTVYSYNRVLKTIKDWFNKKWAIVLFLCILIASSLILILKTNAKFSNSKISESLVHENKTFKTESAFAQILKEASLSGKIATPTVSLSPALQLSPTATPDLGYCLNVPILYYHHTEPWSQAVTLGHTSLAVDSGIFDEQMSYLTSHGYNTIFADELVNDLVNHIEPPAKSVVITLDDGYQDNYDYAFQSAKKYNVKLSLMVPTGLLGITSGTNTYFSWDELSTMVSSGLVRAYDHTWSHYALNDGNTQKDQFEIMTGQNELQQHLGTVYNIFAYPYGSGATSNIVTDILSKDGFVGAYSTIPGTYQCTSYILALRRTRIGSSPFPAFGIE